MYGGSRTYSFARETFLRHVVNAPSIPMDMYSLTFFNEFCPIEAFSAAILQDDSLMFSTLPKILQPDPRSQTKDRFFSQAKIFEMMSSYAESHNITYSYVVIARPDLIYNRNLDIKMIEKRIDEIGDNALLIPECCNFGHSCDRFAISSMKGMQQMLNGTHEWYEKDPQANHSEYEQAFKLRANFTNMSLFDEQYSYSFATLRMSHLKNACNRSEPVNTHWTENICFKNEDQQQMDLVESYTPVPTGGCAMVYSYYDNNATCGKIV